MALYEADGLLTNDAVVAAARLAWGEYLRYAAYVCQPDRSFREGVTHFACYYRGHIQPAVPKIIAWVPNVAFTEDAAAQQAAAGREGVARVVRRMLADGVRAEGDPHGVMLLTPQDHDQTVRLSAPVANGSRTEAGKPRAWTQGQRYTSVERLRGAVYTSQL